MLPCVIKINFQVIIFIMFPKLRVHKLSDTYSRMYMFVIVFGGNKSMIMYIFGKTKYNCV